MRAFLSGGASNRSKAEHCGDAGLTIAVLAALGVGVFTELEQAAAVVVAVLVDGAGVAVAFLNDDAVIARSVLRSAGRVAIAVLADVGAAA